MSQREGYILAGLLAAIILVGAIALFIVQSQATSAAIESAHFAATQRQLERNLDRAMTPDG